LTDADRLNLEILGLLLQVAWADEEVGSKEAASIIGRAKRLKVPDDYLEVLVACLRGEKTLPPPDMGFLRKHRDEALAAVKMLIAEDNVVTEGEAELLQQIDDLLST